MSSNGRQPKSSCGADVREGLQNVKSLLAEPWFQLAYQKSDSWPDSVVLCE